MAHSSSSSRAAQGSAAASEGLSVVESDSVTPAWRQLPFYEASPVRDASDFARTPAVFRSSSSITATEPIIKRPAFVSKKAEVDDVETSKSATAQYVLFGQSSGKIVVCDTEHYSILGSWTAFFGINDDAKSVASSGRVTHISCDTAGRVVTLGEDAGVRFPVLRVWDLRMAVKTGNGQICPRLLAEAKVQHGSKPFPVASIAQTPTFSFLAIGLGDGTVLLLRGLSESLDSAPKKIDQGSASVPAVTLPKFKVIHQASSRPGDADFMDTVTGLGFAEHPTPSSQNAFKPVQKSSGPAPRKQRNRITDVSYESDPPLANGVGAWSTSGTVHLFIVTLSKILRYIVLGKGAGTPASIIDDVGCALNCAAILPMEQHVVDNIPSGETSRLSGKMVVAREEAIYVIGSEGREVSLAYEGRKSAIRLCATQLIIISPPMKASAASTSATVRHYVSGRDRKAANGARDLSPRNNEVAKVTVFDLESKLVAYSGTFEGGVRDAWSEAEGGISILSDDGSLTRLDEKSLRQKLDLLFRKSLYLLAINVARSHASRSSDKNSSDTKHNINPLLGDIHRKYADYLYEKGDFEGAINQFVKTIGVVQPSYVIRKFLDAQRITNLTIYLQELHAFGLANADHTTLLLNCFAKLKDVASLDKFIKRPVDKPVERSKRTIGDRNDESESEDEDGRANQDDLPFDLETAIRVCRQGGYFQHAAFLAQRYGQTDEFVRIQIEDLDDYQAAMHYIRSQSIEDAQRNLVRYGRKMLDRDARSTTDLLIELCSGAFEPIPVHVGSGVDASKVQSKTNYLSYLNVSEKVRKVPLQNGLISNGSANEASAAKAESAPQTPQLDAVPAAKHSSPSPSIFFAHFVDHREQFARFLKTVALARWDQAIHMDDVKNDVDLPQPTSIGDEGDEYIDEDLKEQRAVWNTFLEIQLNLAKGEVGKVNGSAKETLQNGAEKASDEHERTALALLRQFESLPYDVGQALIVCTAANFSDGIVFLYERLGMYEDIVRLYMASDVQNADDEQNDAGAEGEKLLSALQRYGSHDADLYVLVLCHLVATASRLDNHRSDVERILTHIFDEQLLSPLEVVQLLSKKGVATIGLLREHLMRALEAQQSDIATNASLTKTYRDETRTKEAEIEALRDVSQPRIFQQSKCSACGGQLDLPSVHFMCRHSFHSRCLGEGENECPLCAQSHGVILEIRRNNLQFGQRHDLFINEVEEAEDGFDVVANMFSKGLLGAQQLGEQR